MKKKIVITKISRWSYFQWFLLGFYQLKEEGILDISFQIPWIDKLTLYTESKICTVLLRKFNSKYRANNDQYNLEGYLQLENGSKKYFCIDPADSPFLFDREALQSVDCYFKMQCPDQFEEIGFKLAKDVIIPWQEHRHIQEELMLIEKGPRKLFEDFHIYSNKVYPLMIGCRRLSHGNGFRSLQKGYDNYYKERNVRKEKKIMCYFGNAKGPIPSVAVTEPDFDKEKDLMGYYQQSLTHPNEKRAKVAEYLRQNEENDARVISEGESDIRIERNNQAIPLEEFCAHVAKFEYNFNVSGYRLSIPNRFIESFIVGTGIITDKLQVKWYKPFDQEEVIETVPMGYLKDEEVDWQTMQNDIAKIPTVDSKKIIESFEKKWAPKIVAQYLLDTIERA